MQALQLVRQMLQHPPAERPEAYASAARLTIQAAYAALTVSDQAVFAALDALSFVQQQGEHHACVGQVLVQRQGG